MQKSSITVLLALSLLLPQMAIAQDKPKRSANDYVCILSGKCKAAEAAAPQAPQARTKEAPVALQSFSLATPRVDLRLTFNSGSATLTASAAAEARTVAKALRNPALAAKRFRIEGHTDSVGSRASNLTLSQRRADAVRAYLVAQGVSRGRLDAKGYGFDRPLAGRSASYAGNRRVEAVALP